MDEQIRNAINQIYNNVPLVYQAGLMSIKGYTKQEANNLFANAITTTAQGTSAGVEIDNASPLVHNITVKAENKNLFNYKSSPEEKYLVSNLQAENNQISFKNEAANVGMFVRYNLYLPAGQYYIQYSRSASDGVTNFGIGVMNSATGSFIFNASASGNNGTFTVSNGVLCYIYIYASRSSAVGTTFTFENVQITKGTTASEYVPFVDISTLTARLTTTDVSDVQTGAFNADGVCDTLTSRIPMTISIDGMTGLPVEVTYNRDLIKVIAQIEQLLTPRTALRSSNSIPNETIEEE